MMFTGRHEPETYGELIWIYDDPDASDWLDDERGHHPGEGLLVLQIQDRLYKFLVDCWRAILHDISAEQFGQLATVSSSELCTVESVEDTAELHRNIF